MPTDFQTLLRRDQVDLQHEIAQLLDPAATLAELRTSLDGVRLGLTAHAEAEDIVLGRFEEVPALSVILAQQRASHAALAGALAALVSSRPGTTAWRSRAGLLRDLVEHHARHEETHLIPALRAHVPPELYGQLAGMFATERLRQLAMLQPSAPIYIPAYALAQAG